MHTSAERRASLGQWGFACRCALCAAPAAAAAASDARRTQLANITDEITAALRGWDMRGAAAVAERGLGLLRDEGLEAASGELHKSLAVIYWILGDEGAARDHARRAVDYKADFGLIGPSDRAAEVEDMIAGFDRE